MALAETVFDVNQQVTEEGRHVEGVYVHYRPRRVLHMSPNADVTPMMDSLSSSVISHDLFSGHTGRGGNIYPSGKSVLSSTSDDSFGSTAPWSTVTVMNAFASSYVLSRLSSNTEYEVFLAPFSDTETGQPTALLTNVTFESGTNTTP